MIATTKTEGDNVRSTAPGVAMTVTGVASGVPPELTDRCHPVLVRRWRNGKIVWEGQPDEVRVLHRRYPALMRPRTYRGERNQS